MFNTGTGPCTQQTSREEVKKSVTQKEKIKGKKMRKSLFELWRRKQCFSLSNVLICIIGHLTAALSVIALASIVYLMCLWKAFYSHRNDLEMSKQSNLSLGSRM